MSDVYECCFDTVEGIAGSHFPGRVPTAIAGRLVLQKGNSALCVTNESAQAATVLNGCNPPLGSHQSQCEVYPDISYLQR